MSALPDQLPSPRGASPGPGTGRHALAQQSPLLQVGAALGMAGTITGIVLLIFTCAGFDAALDFCPVVITLGCAGGILTFLATLESSALSDSSVVATFFVSALALLGGVLELAVWMQWPILFHG